MLFYQETKHNNIVVCVSICFDLWVSTTYCKEMWFTVYKSDLSALFMLYMCRGVNFL